MKTLSEKGFKATGTFRTDRTNGCPLKCVKEFKKMDRGEHQYFTSGNQIELIRWNGNNVATIGSNVLSVQPVGTVKQWKWGKGSVNVSQPLVTTIGSNALSVQPVGTVKQWKRGKGSVNVSQPHASKMYNKCVGGVDLVDRTLSDLRPSFSGKKWYRSLIINALNLGFVYCWRLRQLCTKPKGDQKSFCWAVVQVALMKVHNKVPRPGPSFAISDEARFDGKGHYPAPGPVRKCALCKKNCRNVCEKCNKSLHTKLCFQLFHEK